jgi:protein-S-isoprenylcysteine O-methyltransferase Ste14
MKKLLSLLFPISLISAIVVIAFIRFHTFNQTFLIVIGIYLLWLFFELIISKRDFSDKSKSNDFHTREIYAISQGLTILSAIIFSNGTDSKLYYLIGAFVLCSGLFLRVTSIIYLGKFYSHNVRLLDKHEIIINGPYSIIRHPAYSGMILIHIGISIISWNVITLMILFLLLIPSIILRIVIEEKTLKKLPKYKKYSKMVKRLIPYIW